MQKQFKHLYFLSEATTTLRSNIYAMPLNNKNDFKNIRPGNKIFMQ